MPALILQLCSALGTVRHLLLHLYKLQVRLQADLTLGADNYEVFIRILYFLEPLFRTALGAIEQEIHLLLLLAVVRTWTDWVLILATGARIMVEPTAEFTIKVEVLAQGHRGEFTVFFNE